MPRRIVRCLAIALLLCAGVLLKAEAAEAVGTYNNAAIADTALAYVGQWGGNACRDAGKMQSGQCKQFVNCIVYMVSGGTQYPVDPNGDYQNSYAVAGGVEVTSIASVIKGDIIQYGSTDADAAAGKLHTAIVVANKGDGKFNVVDSNYNHDEMVTQHDYTPPSGSRYWRMGTVTNAGPLAISQPISVGPSSTVAMYTPVGYSYRVRNVTSGGVSVQRMVVAVRGPGGSNLDSPCSNGVALAAGQEFTCAVTMPTGYGSTGQFQFWADWLDFAGNWHTGQLGSMANYLQVTQAATLTTTGALSVGPANPVHMYQGVYWSYRVQNTSGSYASVKRFEVAVRTPGGGAMDVPCQNGDGVTLAPAQEWTCAAYNSNGYGSTGAFAFWADWQDYANQWHAGQLSGMLTLYVVN